MKLTRLALKNYRNLRELELSCGEHVNIIYGDNAQGKTNILEAIWLFTGNQSFRGAKASELVRFDEPFADLSLSFADAQREQTMEMRLGSRRRFRFNQVPLKSASEFAGHFYGVIFSPDDLDLVKGSPAGRRRFLDDAITQLRPQYREYLDKYEKVLDQRNSLLKELERRPSMRGTLFIWDEQLAKLGTILHIYRNDYVQKLSRVAAKLYEGMTGADDFSITYQSTVFEHPEEVTSYEDAFIETYEQKLSETLDVDARFCHTTAGIHRDDLGLFLKGLPVKNYGSQGQQRSAVLLLKLAEAELLQRITGEAPVILLDDVMSELDATRQHYILNHVKTKQVFITCCDIYNTFRLEEGKIFQIRDGALVEETTVIPENGA